MLILAVAIECLALCVFIYVPVVREILGLTPLTARHWALAAAPALVLACAEELRKAIVRRAQTS